MSLLNEIKSEIDSHEIISFDIFDTLLLRPYVKPTDLFFHLEKLENKKGFAKARIEAEKQARKTHSDLEDINIDEIYDEIKDEYKSLKEKEMALEAEVLTANPEMKEVYDYALKQNKKIIIVSDMYLPEDFLHKTLIKNGYTNFRLYVSGDKRKKKGSGTIYQYVLKKLNLEPKKIIHIGDNRRSDYEVPINMGMSAYYYEQVINRYLKQNEKAKIFLEKYKDNLEASVMIMNFALHWLKNQEEDFWSRIGYEYGGPMCYAYMRWVEQQVLEKGIKEILFVARDGYSLQKVFDSFGHKDIKTHYVYAPRQVYQNCNIEKAIKQKTVLAALRYYQQIDKNIYQNSKHINSEQDAIHFIQNHRSIFNKLEEKESNNYHQYIDNLHIKQKDLALIDTVTGNVSSQQLICQHLYDKNILGLYWYMLGKSRKYLSSYNMQSWDSSYSNNNIRCWDFVEYMMTSPEPPIKNIKNNQIIYITNISEDEKKRETLYPTISEKICLFAQNLQKITNISFSEPLIIEWTNLLFTHPSKIEQKKLGNINIAYDASHTQVRPLYSLWSTIKKHTQKLSLFGLPIAKLHSEKVLLWQPDAYEIKKKIKMGFFTLMKIKKSPIYYKIYFCGIKLFSYKDNGIYCSLKIVYIPIFTLHKNYEVTQNTSHPSNAEIQKQYQNIKKLNTETLKSIQSIEERLFYTQQSIQQTKNTHILETLNGDVAVCSTVLANMWWVYPKIKIRNYWEIKEEPKYCFLWGGLYNEHTNKTLQIATSKNLPVYIWENGFLRSAAGWGKEAELGKYTHGISFMIDRVPYYDATQPNTLENLLNNKDLIISEEEKSRARKCINKIVETHLTKYNHQPIYTPNIGRPNVKKVLVIDQTYNDMSIIKGRASEQTFINMLDKAIKENPNADIIIKTHPDTIAGQRGGYYTNIEPHDNVFVETETINPISLIKYVDKVYVCSSQLGFEALMCGKEVRVFGMPFYAGWGLTQDEQTCERRTNKRSLEEVFYIAYILYTIYINEEKGCRCEIEEAMDYLLKLRKEFFAEKNIKNELNF